MAAQKAVRSAEHSAETMAAGTVELSVDPTEFPKVARMAASLVELTVVGKAARWAAMTVAYLAAPLVADLAVQMVGCLVALRVDLMAEQMAVR